MELLIKLAERELFTHTLKTNKNNTNAVISNPELNDTNLILSRLNKMDLNILCEKVRINNCVFVAGGLALFYVGDACCRV